MQKTEKSFSWNSFNKNLPSNYLNIDNGIENETPKVRKNSSANNSTLALHIEAWEESNVEPISDKEASKFIKKWKNAKLISAVLSSDVIEVTFRL